MEQGENNSLGDDTDETTASDSSSVEARLEKKLEGLVGSAEETTAKPATESAAARNSGELSVNRGEVSAATLARMMGLATATEVGLLEGKLDLLSSRVNSITIRMEKVLNALNKLPQASDMDRIDVNIGSLKTMIRDTLEKTAALAEMDQSGETSLSNVKIMTSEEVEEELEDSDT